MRETASRFPLSIYPAQTHFRATHMFYLVITSPSGTVTLVRKAVRPGLRATCSGSCGTLSQAESNGLANKSNCPRRASYRQVKYMSGPKMGLGRVDREEETAGRFSHSLPGPLSPFPEPHVQPRSCNFPSRSHLYFLSPTRRRICRGVGDADAGRLTLCPAGKPLILCE